MLPATSGADDDASPLQTIAKRLDLSQLPQAAVRSLESELSFAAPTKLVPGDVKAATASRSRLGFRSDEAFVNDLYANPSRYEGLTVTADDFVGLVLTPTEATEMVMRNYLQFSLYDLNGRLRALDPEFVESAMRFDASAEVTTATFLTSSASSDKILSEATALMPVVLRDRVRAVVAPANPDTVRSLAQRVDVALSGIEPGYGTGYWLDYWSGTVVVTGPSQDTYDQILTQFGPSNLAFSLSDVPAQTADKDQPQPYWLVYSSLNFSGACTSGFAVQSGYGQMVLTAGHCFGANFMVTQGGANVGRVAAVQGQTGDFDAETVASFQIARPVLGRLHNWSGDYIHQITGWIGQDTDSTGMNICHSGITTGGNTGNQNLIERCGDVYQLNFKPTFTGTNFNPKFRLSHAQSRRGDSGGGVFWGTMYGFLAIGLMSGHRCDTETCAADAIVTHLPYVQNAWGLTVLTN